MRTLVVTALLFFAGMARAEYPNHSNAKAAAWREGNQVVGLKLTVRLQTNGARFPRVRVGLVEKGKATGLRGASAQHGDHPQLFLHQFDYVSVPTDGSFVEETLQVRYGQGNSLKSGMAVAVVSRWPTSENANLYHIWADQGSAMQEIELP